MHTYESEVSCAMLPGIARNKKGKEGGIPDSNFEIQKAINKHMKDNKYRWRNYNPPDGDDEEEEEDDVPLVSGTLPIRICLFLCLYRMYPRTHRFLTGYIHHSFLLPPAYISTQCASKAAWVQ